VGESLAGLDVSGTTHTHAGTYNDTWTFTDVTGNYNNASGTVSDQIDKANASITVHPYHVTYDGNAHTATGSATGVVGESLAGLDLSGTTHTHAGTYNDTWTFTDVTGNYNNASGTVTDQIDKANAIISVTPYGVTYDGNAHTATGSAIGVQGESLAGLNLSGTTHTNAGDYPADAWTFTDVTGNYNNASGTVHDSISKANTTTSVVSSANPSASGQSVTFTATVSAVPPGAGTPTAMVTFLDGTSTLGTASLSSGKASFSTATLTVGNHTITASYGGDSNFNTSASTAVTQTVNGSSANTSTSVVSSLNPSVYGQSVTFTATVTPNSPSPNNPTGTVTFYDGGVSIGAGTLSGTSSDKAAFTTGTLSAGTHTITAAYTSGDGNFNPSAPSSAITQTVNKDGTTTTATPSSTSSSYGQLITISVTVTANAPGSGTPTGSVDFFDQTTGTDLGNANLVGGHATFTSATLSVGSQTIVATYSGDSNFLTSNSTLAPITVAPSIIVLDPTAGGALDLSGNAAIKISGTVTVDSNSTQALTANGNASLTAGSIQVVGGDLKNGNAVWNPTPVTGAPYLADPLAGLPAPNTTGMTNYGAVILTKGSRTISQGIYTQISVSGTASLTMNSGVYIIEGGGISISGGAAVTGTNVLIFNTNSTYPNAGGTFGHINFSGTGTFNVTAPATGTYAGIVVFQARTNSLAINISGNAVTGLRGVVYAPQAQLQMSGNGTLNDSLIVDTAEMSGNIVKNTLTNPFGGLVYTPAQIRTAYGISSLAQDGTGQSIAIVAAYDDPSIYTALDSFDVQFGTTTSGQSLYQQYGPGTTFLQVIGESGQTTSLPGTDPGGIGNSNWATEESLDAEWVHSIAPGAKIILVECQSESLPDLMQGVATAAAQPGVSVVSMSWGFTEGTAVVAADEANYDPTFIVPGVTFVASTGDFGTNNPEYPAYSPNVVAVGGTTLNLNSDNSYQSETGWGYNSTSAGTFIGSGGGLGMYEGAPAYQTRVQSTGHRTNPDVATVSDPNTGAWIADPYNLAGSNPFTVAGGTSLAAPIWAGLFGLINQGRAASGKSALNTSGPTAAMQGLYTLPQSDYNVITSGTNWGYNAAAGYNLVTGLGSPIANKLVTDLIAYAGSGSFATTGLVAPINANLNATGNPAGTSPTDPITIFNVLGPLSRAIIHASSLSGNVDALGGAANGNTVHSLSAEDEASFAGGSLQNEAAAEQGSQILASHMSLGIAPAVGSTALMDGEMVEAVQAKLLFRAEVTSLLPDSMTSSRRTSLTDRDGAFAAIARCDEHGADREDRGYFEFLPRVKGLHENGSVTAERERDARRAIVAHPLLAGTGSTAASWKQSSSMYFSSNRERHVASNEGEPLASGVDAPIDAAIAAVAIVFGGYATLAFEDTASEPEQDASGTMNTCNRLLKRLRNEE
jgi:hypothetical protein